MRRAAYAVDNALAAIRIAHLIRRKRVTVVHVHSGIGGMVGRAAARLVGAKIVVYTPNAWPFLATGDRRLAAVYRWLERRAARWTDALVCVSREEERLGRLHRIAPPEKFTYIPNGIALPINSLPRAEARAALRLPPQSFVIGSITRFTYQKDPLGTLEALAPLLRERPSTCLCLIGDGPLLSAVVARAAALGVRAQVRCPKFFADASAMLSAFDVFLLSSRYEGLAYGVLEAMAAGLPVVTTAAGNADAVQTGVNGAVVPFGDRSALRAAIAPLLDDVPLRRQYGEQSRRLVARFGVDRMVHDTEALYLRLAKQKGLVVP